MIHSIFLRYNCNTKIEYIVYFRIKVILCKKRSTFQSAIPFTARPRPIIQAQGYMPLPPHIPVGVIHHTPIRECIRHYGLTTRSRTPDECTNWNTYRHRRRSQEARAPINIYTVYKVFNFFAFCMF